MIVSYLHNYIFIKTKKTAGTTVEAVLAPSCGPDDVVTFGKVAPGDKSLARNTYLDPELEAAFRSRGKRRPTPEERQAGRARGILFGPHTNAETARGMIDPKFWDGAFKFTSERHPYEKAVSQAYFRFAKRGLPADEFPAHLDGVVRNGDYLGFPRWSIDGKAVIDDFVRQETLRADLGRIGARLGIPIPNELPQKKTASRVDRRPAREILTDEQKAIVYERCAQEFEILGWER
jgi:hypothetical protein